MKNVECKILYGLPTFATPCPVFDLACLVGRICSLLLRERYEQAAALKGAVERALGTELKLTIAMKTEKKAAP